VGLLAVTQLLCGRAVGDENGAAANPTIQVRSFLPVKPLSRAGWPGFRMRMT